MPVIDETNMYEELEFTCNRCNTECEKTSAAETEYGYLSIVDQSWVGPICSKCVDELRKNHQQVVEKNVPETIFAVVVYPNGAGAVYSDFDIAKEAVTLYHRKPKPYDIISACTTVVTDINESRTLSRLNSLLNSKRKV
jgi:hypothetical protein